jgi:hypothetical protein
LFVVGFCDSQILLLAYDDAHWIPEMLHSVAGIINPAFHNASFFQTTSAKLINSIYSTIFVWLHTSSYTAGHQKEIDAFTFAKCPPPEW